MALLVLGFLVILTITFGLVIAMTRRSPEELAIEQRILSIRQRQRSQDGVPAETAQLLKTIPRGKFDWAEDLLGRFAFVQRLRLHTMQANSSMSVGTLISVSLGLFLLGYAIAWLVVSMVFVDLGCGAALSLLPYAFISWKRRKRIKAFNAALAESIDMLGRALRAGHSVVSGLEMLSQNAEEPAASEFGEVFKQQNLGLPLREALVQLLHRVPSADLRVLVTAILVQRDTGGNLAEILDRTVFVIRERLRIEGEIQIQTAQGRMTGWILSALPIVMLVLLNLLNPGYSRILLTDPMGRKLTYVSLGMLGLGSLIIRKIVNGIEV